MRRRSELIQRASTVVLGIVLLATSVRSLCAIEPCVSNLFPVVSITKPTNGQFFTYASTVRIRANALDSDGSITRVEFFVGTNYLGSATNAPYTNNWENVWPPDPPYVPYVLTARAIDNCGGVSTSAPVAIFSIQDIHVPWVVIEGPPDGSLFRPGSAVQILASIRTSDGSENPVSFYSGEDFLGTAPEPPYTVTLSNLQAGSHIITAQNTDDFSQVGTSRPITVTVADLKLGSPFIDSSGHFKFGVSGVVTGSPLVLLSSSNLFTWQTIETNIPSTPLIELDVGLPAGPPQRYFRVLSEK